MSKEAQMLPDFENQNYERELLNIDDEDLTEKEWWIQKKCLLAS
jgi:hypothetical protein